MKLGILSFGILASGTQMLAATQVEEISVFAEDIVSVENDNLFRGNFSPDGDSFYFFRKIDPDAEDYRIWVTTNNGERWGQPIRVVLGEDGHSDLYPTISPDGERLVFSSYRPVDGDTSNHPNANLWMSRRNGSGWGDPVLLGASTTLANYDAGPWIDGDGVLHWVSTTPDWRNRMPRLSRPTENGYAAFESDPKLDRWANLSGQFRLWDAIPSPDGSFVILGVSRLEGNRPLPSDLWIAFRQGSGWSEPVSLGETVNSAGNHENFVTFDPTSGDMLFVRAFATYFRVSRESLIRLR